MKKSILLLIFAGGMFFASNAYAVDGVVLINQTNALAGNVTPGDTPGFPVTISQPGSYRLSSNLSIPDPGTPIGTAGGIEIKSDNVTIDLNGFTIFGGASCFLSGGNFGCNGPAVSGIFALSGFSNITIRNGIIRDLMYWAVSLPSCKDVLLDHLMFVSSSYNVFAPNGANVVIRDCLAILSGGAYLNNGIVEGVVLANGDFGMIGNSLTVRDSLFVGNLSSSFSAGSIVGFSGVSFMGEPAPTSGFSLGQNTLNGVIW